MLHYSGHGKTHKCMAAGVINVNDAEEQLLPLEYWARKILACYEHNFVILILNCCRHNLDFEF